MRIEPIAFGGLRVQRYDDPTPRKPRRVPDLRYDVTLIVEMRDYPDEDWGVPLEMRNHARQAMDYAIFPQHEGMQLSQASQELAAQDQLWPIWANKDQEGQCLFVSPRAIYHFSPGEILAVQLLFVYDAMGRLHVRFTLGKTRAAGEERDRPAQPYRRSLTPTGSPLSAADRWRLLYPELDATLHGGSDSPHVHTLWLNLKDDPTDPVAWDAFADAMEEEGVYTPTRERQAARLIREGLLLGCTPVGPGQRHPGLLWPGQTVKP